MPSSREHCEICPFALVGEGLEAEEPIEQVIVREHILALARRENGHRADPSPPNIAPSRIFAARACAKWIVEQKCTRFVSLNVHKLGDDTDAVLIVERETDY